MIVFLADLQNSYYRYLRNSVPIGMGYVYAYIDKIFGDDIEVHQFRKFEDMYAGKIHCPLIVRTPMGGRRGYGPTHSQSLEKFFLGIPNLSVIALNHRISPRPLTKSFVIFTDKHSHVSCKYT